MACCSDRALARAFGTSDSRFRKTGGVQLTARALSAWHFSCHICQIDLVLHVAVFFKKMMDKNREVKPIIAQTWLHRSHSKKKTQAWITSLHKFIGRKEVQTARSEDQSLHTCPCISDRQLRLLSHGPGLSAKTMHKDKLEKSTLVYGILMNHQALFTNLVWNSYFVLKTNYQWKDVRNHQKIVLSTSGDIKLII